MAGWLVRCVTNRSNRCNRSSKPIDHYSKRSVTEIVLASSLSQFTWPIGAIARPIILRRMKPQTITNNNNNNL